MFLLLVAVVSFVAGAYLAKNPKVAALADLAVAKAQAFLAKFKKEDAKVQVTVPSVTPKADDTAA